MPIKLIFGPVNNILEPFKQKEKGQKKNFELKSLYKKKKKLYNSI